MDVPALDAVLFLTPRNSKVDVVQSVGRVMRRAEGKKQGYVILPVVIPPGIEPEAALDKNENYKVVWDVLNALRSHDDRFDAMINKLEFNGKDTDKLEIVAITGQNFRQMEVVSKVGKITPKAKRNKQDQVLREARNSYNIGQSENRIRYKKPCRLKQGQSNAPSTPKSSKNVATATIGKTGRATSPKSPAPILTASMLF